MNSTPTITVGQMELTAMKVTFMGTEVGGTHAGSVIEIKTMKGDIKADQYGTTILDRRVIGCEAKVTLDFAEVRNVDKWTLLFPNMVTATSGSNKSITMQLPIGSSDVAVGGLLTLHPVVKSDADTSQDWTIYQACPSVETSLTYGPDKQVTGKIVFNVYPLISGSNQPKMLRYGNPSIGT